METAASLRRDSKEVGEVLSAPFPRERSYRVQVLALQKTTEMRGRRILK